MIARCEKKLKEATGDAAGAERLCKIGVLSTVEMEHRLLKVIQCEGDLANARVEFCKAKVAELASRIASGETATDELASTRAALAQLTEAAQIATAKRERAELEAAEANVRRQQKLLKLGIAGKSDVDRAEEKLAELKAPKN
jgi:multidrug resistance efflux pump